MRSLVIDDEFMAGMKLAELLKPHGSCRTAVTANQALTLFRSALRAGEPYELVTIDIQLPDMNGLDLLRALQQAEAESRHPPARKLMVSANGTRDNVRSAACRGCDGFLIKPVQRDALLARLVALGLVPPPPPPRAQEVIAAEPANPPEAPQTS